MRTRYRCVWCITIIALIIGLAVRVNVSKERLVRNHMAGPCFSVGWALEMYANKYGKLPPYVVNGPNNEPYHSWRILLMETMDTNLYKEYDFTVPWSHEHNRQVASRFNPFSVSRETTTCQLFRVLVPADEGDGKALENRFLVIEHRGKDIMWTEPRDLTPEQIDNEMLRDEPFVYVFGKGQTRLRPDADPAQVREAFTQRLDPRLIRSLLLYSTPKPLDGQ
jgi:hypothetical protein